MIEKLEIFPKLPPIKIETDLNILKNSYSNICHAIEFTPNSITADEIYRMKINELSSFPESKLFLWRTTHGIRELWRKFKLEKEFERAFPYEQLFWNSEDTFIEIYRMLKSSKTIS